MNSVFLLLFKIQIIYDNDCIYIMKPSLFAGTNYSVIYSKSIQLSSNFAL